MSRIKEFFLSEHGVVCLSGLMAIPIAIGFASLVARHNAKAVIAEASRPRSVIAPDGRVVDGCTVRTETVTRRVFLAPDGTTVLVVEEIDGVIKPRSNQ